MFNPVKWIKSQVSVPSADTIESLRRELEEAKRDADEYEQVAANHIHANEALHKQLAAQAATIAKLRDAMEQAGNEIRRCDYTPARSTLLVALAATESPDQVLRNGETK